MQDITVRYDKKGEPVRVKGDVPENWKKGDFVKIPLWNENTKSFEYTSAGIGKYVGKISDFKKGEVIVPESLKGEFIAENYPVFEIRTHGGSQVQKIAIGTTQFGMNYGISNKNS